MSTHARAHVPSEAPSGPFPGALDPSGREVDDPHFQLEVLRRTLQRHQVRRLLHVGCGDGAAIEEVITSPGVHGREPTLDAYLGLDPSDDAIARAHRRYAGVDRIGFATLDEAPAEPHDLAVSLDALHRVVDEGTYTECLDRLFGGADLVLIHANLWPGPSGDPAIVYRDHPREIAERHPAFALIGREPHPVRSTGFLLYRRQDERGPRAG